MIEVDFNLDFEGLPIELKVFDESGQLVVSQKKVSNITLQSQKYTFFFSLAGDYIQDYRDLGFIESGTFKYKTEHILSFFQKKLGAVIGNSELLMQEEGNLVILIERTVNANEAKGNLQVLDVKVKSIVAEIEFDGRHRFIVRSQTLKPQVYYLKVEGKNNNKSIIQPVVLTSNKKRFVHLVFQGSGLGLSHQFQLESNEFNLEDYLKSRQLTLDRMSRHDLSTYHLTLVKDIANEKNQIAFLHNYFIRNPKADLNSMFLEKVLHRLIKTNPKNPDLYILYLWLISRENTKLKLPKAANVNTTHIFPFELSSTYHFLLDISVWNPHVVPKKYFQFSYYESGYYIRQSDTIPIKKELWQDIPNENEVEGKFHMFYNSIYNYEEYGHTLDGLGSYGSKKGHLFLYLLNLPVQVFLAILEDRFYAANREKVSGFAQRLLNYKNEDMHLFNDRFNQVRNDSDSRGKWFPPEVVEYADLTESEMRNLIALFWKEVTFLLNPIELVRTLKMPLHQLLFYMDDIINNRVDKTEITDKQYIKKLKSDNWNSFHNARITYDEAKAIAQKEEQQQFELEGYPG